MNEILTFDVECEKQRKNKVPTSMKIPLKDICIEKEKGEILLTYYTYCEACHNSHKQVLLRRKFKEDEKKDA